MSEKACPFKATQLKFLARASCVGGREFEFHTGQISHSVANGSTPLQHLRK